MDTTDRTELRGHRVLAIQGNYDESLASGRADYGCGYTDPRDNHFARISYEYTFTRTSSGNRAWLGTLARHRRVSLGEHRVLMCHGSPRVINEFLWESTTPHCLLRRFLRDESADVLICSHTGLKRHRALPGGGHAVNVGVIGRPENDGSTNVWYTVLSAGSDLDVEFDPPALRARDARFSDRGGGITGRVRGNDPDRPVDHLSREPASERARPRQVLMSGWAATTRAHGGRVIVLTVVIGSAIALAWRLGIWDLLRPGPSCHAGSARLVVSRQDRSGGETLQMTCSG